MLNFIKKLKAEHDSIDIYQFNDFYTYENIDDLRKIVYDEDTPQGVYVYEQDENEVLIKKVDFEGRILIGLSYELTTLQDSLYVATDDGLTIKDDSRVVSKSSVEQFLVMADMHGFEEFILVETTCDKHINFVNWYGKKSDFDIELI